MSFYGRFASGPPLTALPANTPGDQAPLLLAPLASTPAWHTALVATEPRLVQPDDIVAARELLRDVISPTPVLRSRALSELAGGPVFLKCENLQRTGSFKVRGAYLRIARLTDEQRARGVVAASAGNHAQGVAYAATLLDTESTVFMPEGAPLPKIQATRDYGADIVLQGSSVEDALDGAREFAAKTGSVLIHPFEHPDVITGQGTLGFEIIEQCPQVRTVVIPVRGARLAAGRRRRGRGQEPGPGGADHGGAVGRGGAVPGLAGGRAPDPGQGRADDGRRDRGQPARRA